MFEAVHTEQVAAPPAEIWALWEDPARWPEWNTQIEHAELDGELAVGATAVVKFRRGGRVRFEVVALEPERLLTDEARFPGARLGREHRLEPRGEGSEITHRLYVSGPVSGFWSLMLGRRRMRGSVAEFAARERALTEGST